MTGIRAERVGDLLRRLLAQTIREDLRDPRLGFITLTHIKVSPDLRQALVFVTILGSEQRAAALEALNHTVPFLRRALARDSGLRFTPRLKFVYDDSAEEGQRLDGLLDDLRHQREGVHESDSPSLPAETERR